MAKPQTKQPVKKPKSLKDTRKELEARLFGEKDKKKKKEIQGMIKKLDMDIEKELKSRKEAEEAKKTVVRQLIPLGVDPKTIYCANFKNKCCPNGDKCQFSHVPVAKENKETAEVDDSKPKMVCKFLVDALNNREFNGDWKCPMPNCRDLHKLTEMSENKEIELGLEEFLELQRQGLSEQNLTPVTEESFKAWKDKKTKEEILHAKRVAALSVAPKGVDLFKYQPEIFEDADDEGDVIDYHAREATSESEEEESD